MNNSENISPKLISIIIATFNCGQKIEKTLDSIFSQNNELFEVIIFDNASTDDTLSQIEKFRDRLTLISEKDEGVYDAFNKGLETARGRYMYFIGAGDCLRPNILEEIKDFLPADRPRLFYGQCFFMKMQLPNGRKFNARTFICNNICHQGMFYHREIFKILGSYNPRYKIFGDWFFNLRCFLEERIEKTFVPIIIADYEEGGLSAEISRDPNFQKDFPPFVREHFGFFSYLICRTFLKHQHGFTFVYLSGFNALGYAIAAAKPFVRTFRKLKQQF